MSVFDGRIAVITGGASGIGRAVGAEMARRGSRVVLADRNGELAGEVASAIGDRAEAATVDVADAAQVQELVDRTVKDHGRLDYLFNNAGIALFGEVRDMTLDQWMKIVEVNLHGVVHGIVAAYPVMCDQGSGHIVNTASLAGIVPSPGATAYALTKHAVVGVSTSLRGEAQGYGVKVSVVCPGVIDTPLKDSLTYLKLDKEKMLGDKRLKLASVDSCARTILRGVERNRPIIPVTGFAIGAWLLYRLSPRLAAATGPALMSLARKEFRIAD